MKVGSLPLREGARERRVTHPQLARCLALAPNGFEFLSIVECFIFHDPRMAKNLDLYPAPVCNRQVRVQVQIL